MSSSARPGDRDSPSVSPFTPINAPRSNSAFPFSIEKRQILEQHYRTLNKEFRDFIERDRSEEQDREPATLEEDPGEDVEEGLFINDEEDLIDNKEDREIDSERVVDDEDGPQEDYTDDGDSDEDSGVDSSGLDTESNNGKKGKKVTGGKKKQTKKKAGAKKDRGRKGASTYVDVMRALEKDVPDIVQRFRKRGVGSKDGLGLDDMDVDSEFDMSVMIDYIETSNKKKRKRRSAVELRNTQGDINISRDVPKDQRKDDDELLQIGLRSTTESNKTRWREAPYVWNARGYVYEEYFYLIEKKDSSGDYVWDDNLLWKFARDHKMNVYPTRQPLPGLLNARGELRRRAPRQTKSQRGPNGKYVPDVPEARQLTDATRNQIIYMRQQEVKDDRTEGVKRTEKERKESEERAMTINERAAATSTAGTVLHNAIKEHTKDLFNGFHQALAELEESKKEVAQLLNTRNGLIERESGIAETRTRAD